MPLLIVPPAGATASGQLRWQWLDPTGVLRDLTFNTSVDLFVSKGAAGLGTPPVELRLEKLPTTAGSLHRYTQTKPLEIALPLYVQGTSMAALLAMIHTLRGWFDTGDERRRTPGYLRITRPQDDAVRQIACVYAGGLEGDLEQGGPHGTPLVVALVAPDPYWTDVESTTAAYSNTAVGVSQGVVNAGDFDAYPVWTIHGPASAITVTNTTTGKYWRLTANGGLTLSASDTLVVDTRPASQRETLPVLVNGSVSRFDRLFSGSALWWLVPGANTFVVEATGTSGATTITLAWLPRYRGVLR